jgi:hypothetical protein
LEEAVNPKSLEALPLTAEERERIDALGVPDAVALLAMIRAVPGEFESFFGLDRTREIADLLERSLPATERGMLEAPPPRFPISGAILDRKSPVLRPPDYDVETRDRLFEELQSLRRRGDSSPDTKRQIAQLERSLNALLENG